MLTAELVRTRRRGGRLEVRPLRPAEKKRLLPVASHCIDMAQTMVGQTRGDFDAACELAPDHPTDYKLVRGLRKLVEDRCTFEARDDVDPSSLRKAVFVAAAAVRRSMPETARFHRQHVLETASGDLGADELEQALYADLKQNHRLTGFDPIEPLALLAAFEMAQSQAVLLRAVGVVVHLRCRDAGGYRLFFHRLKFRRLLHSIQPDAEGGYRIDIDGPFSLFKAVTKYGLQLALMLPTLEESGQWTLDAEVRWGKERESLAFHLEGDRGGDRDDTPVRLPDEVDRLLKTFTALDTPWQVAVADELLELPGAGLCVPDLVFSHRDSGFRVFLEVMGYWSRDAVWRRIELVQSGLPQAVLFAVSSRLRVSEEVLDADLPGQLYVYKGVMSATAIAERLAAMHPAV